MDRRMRIMLLAVAILALVLAALLIMPGQKAPAAPGHGNETGTEPGTGPGTEPGTEPAAKLDDSKATPQTSQDVVTGNNRFAIELYSQFDKVEDGNMFFSPYSISTALAMTYEGARGQTATEMLSVFHFPQDDTARRSGFAKLYNLLNPAGKPYVLSTANALWAQTGLTFLQDYFDTVLDYYGGKVTNLDFARDTENSRVTINRWVENQTNNRIKDLIPRGVIDPTTSLVLTNAIYFKGLWSLQFNETLTEDADFRAPAGVVKTPTMRMHKKVFNFSQDDRMQAVELPYKGRDLSMLILLPKGDDLSAIKQELSPEKLSELRGGLSEKEIDIYLPKFKLETKYFMGRDLIAMGMPTAFDAMSADFSGMTGGKDLFIGDVIHQAFVEVNEEGTEAAAATAVVMKTVAYTEPLIFRADHPFIFIIQEKSTGAVLFMGRVSDPSA